MDEAPNKHILSILLDNEAGVLTRVAGLFSARGYNIESLTVAKTEDPAVSRMTVVTFGADELIMQIEKQLNKLVDLLWMVDLSEREYVEQEMLLVKIRCPMDQAAHERLVRFASSHRAGVVEHVDDICIMELTSTPVAIDAFIEALEEWSVLEVVRSGTIGLERGAVTLKA